MSVLVTVMFVDILLLLLTVAAFLLLQGCAKAVKKL